MDDFPQHSQFTRTAVPLGQIAEARSNYGDDRLSFEIELQAANLLDGLDELGRVCRLAGLAPQRLRCDGNGRISCALNPGSGADLTAFEALKPVLVLERWTTIISV